MERIGTLLRRLKLDPENLLAARGHDGAHNFGDAPTGEDQSSAGASMLSGGEGSGPVASNLDEKAGAEAPASGAVMEVNSRNRREGGGTRAKLKLIWINRGPGVNAVPHRAHGLPHPTSGLRLVQVSKGPHASTPWG